MTDLNLTDIIPLIGLYAETHYRFRFFPFSRYYRREPEVIFDAPHRLEPGLHLPVILIVKDAHRFPIEIEKVTIVVTGKDQNISFDIPLNQKVSSPFYHRIFDIDISSLPPGDVTVETSIHFLNRKRLRVVHQDNLAGLSHAPFKVCKASDSLPIIPGWAAGELHTHTSYGCDQVEFGAPPEVIRSCAKALGFGWTALTDHSYNLDDIEDDCLHDDPELHKWQRFQEHVARLNSEAGDVVLLPGEELTCRSDRNRNVHMLILGEETFLPGSGDSAQKWFRTRSELDVAEALARLSENSFAAAAHPFIKTPWLEYLLVKRGKWEMHDLRRPGICGWQILNGNPGEDFELGMKKWVSLLLNGDRKYIYGGNDSHGNFNRFRQVRLPMVALHEHHDHLFGKAMTHVKVGDRTTVNSVISALKSGKATVSNGPAVELTVIKGDRTFSTGEEVTLSSEDRILVRYVTTTEFGCVKQLRLLTAGDDGEKILRQLGEDSEESLPDPYTGELTFEAQGRRYLRVELITRTQEGELHHARSNPIWIKD